MNKLTETAPERIWLQVSEYDDAVDEDFTAIDPLGLVTWCQDLFVGSQVAYVRADLLDQANRRIAELEGEGDGSGFSFTPSDNYNLLLKQAFAMSSLIRSLERQRSIQRHSIDVLQQELSAVSRTEIDALRNTNEVLTNEVEQQAKRIAELEAVLRDAADYLSAHRYNDIGSGSNLHRQMQSALMRGK
jgi:hypothetical protein